MDNSKDNFNPQQWSQNVIIIKVNNYFEYPYIGRAHVSADDLFSV